MIYFSFLENIFVDTVRDADVIIVMQNGRIREIGSPEELMEI